MKLSVFIKDLQGLQEEFGDWEVVLNNYGCSCAYAYADEDEEFIVIDSEIY